MAPNAPSVSIRPSDFTKGGGLINDIDATVKESRWVIWDYNGKSAKPGLSNHVIYVDDDGAEHDAYYSAGDPDAFVPSKDGKTLVKVGKRDGLSDSTNFFQYISSWINAGFPEDDIDGSDVSFMDGKKVHVLREAQPERKGIAKDPNDTREKTVLCISKIYDAKGKATAAKRTATAVGGKANGAAAAAADTGGELDDAAAEAIIMALGEAGGSISKAKLSQALFKQLAGNADRNKIIQFAFKDEFLGADGRPWTFDAKAATVSLGE